MTYKIFTEYRITAPNFVDGRCDYVQALNTYGFDREPQIRPSLAREIVAELTAWLNKLEAEGVDTTSWL